MSRSNLHKSAALVILFLSLARSFVGDAHAQSPDAHTELYFPNATDWETVAPADIGVNEQRLNSALSFAMERRSSSVVILHGGRIVAERHQEVNSPSPRYLRSVVGKTESGQVIEDVASCQKSITAILVGMAQHKQLLQLSDPVSKHLGQGWSKATVAQEHAITIRHLITMTSGLTEDLRFRTEPGERWAYNSTAYSQSLLVVAAAAKMGHQELTEEWLTTPLGMTDSRWVERRAEDAESGRGNRFGFATSARDLARFGLFMLAHGHWKGVPVLADVDFLKATTSPSQPLNPSYGYLWWLNGQEFVARGNRRIDGPLIRAAPDDLYAAQGALGRKCYVVPSRQLVVVRLGDTPDEVGKSRFDETFWRLLAAAAGKR